MDARRWEVIESLYHAALAKEPGERSSYLAAACAEDPTLRREVESLLAYADVQLSSPAPGSKMVKLWDEMAGIPVAGTTAPDQSTDGRDALAVPTTIGQYRIVRLIGEGGMGAVYEAEQEQPRRRVALKVVKPGLATPERLWRFEHESQALGRLQHPGIAQIYEAGAADNGCGVQPYFAMEFIRGESLLLYAEAHELNTRQRLELMVKICEGVEHAHQRGVIHRDLKPGNILVDESGQPKVLDFGIARVTDSDSQATRQTDMGQLVGTLAYMSPEQVIGNPLEVDTRSDVYSLGVILYELLAGRLPYTISRNLPDAVHTILEEDPAPLSSISPGYRGDIQTIVAKSLEKDKARRYASAAGLAGDIRRYLTDEPIVARRPSTGYKLGKFARRHKTLVAAMAAVFVVLLAGIVASTWEATRARRAEQTALHELKRADTEAATAKAVNDFLKNDLLSQASASFQAEAHNKPDPDLKVRTALDRAAAQIEGKFKEQPLVEASIRQTMGKTYEDLGLFPEAQRQIERTLDLRRGVLAEAHPTMLATMNDLAMLYREQGKYPQAQALYTKVLEVWRRTLGEEHADTLTTMNNLALVYMMEGKYAQAEPLFTKGLEVARRVLGEEHPNTLFWMHNLAFLYMKEGKYTQAEPLDIKVLEVARRVLGEEHPNTLAEMHNLVFLYLKEGKYAQAEPLSTKVLGVERRVLGEEHPTTLASMNSLAILYRERGEYRKAELLSAKILEVARRVLGEEHPNTLSGRHNLAFLYLKEGKYTQAEPLYTRVLEKRQRTLGHEHPDTLDTIDDLALLYRYQGKYQQAEALLRTALSTFEKATPPYTWRRYNSQSTLGASLAGQKKYDEAEPLALSGYEGMLQREATIPAESKFLLKQAGEWIVELYQDWGKPGKAAEWREKLKVTTSAAEVQQR